MTLTAPNETTFRNAALPTADRVRSLLDLMTIDEKLAQLGSVWVFQIADRNGLDAERADALLADGIGHVTRISGASSCTARDAAHVANETQRHLRDHTRLGIPAIVHEEICSGLMAREAVALPQAIGVASTFRPDHNRALADAIRLQMRAVGAHHGLSPVLDVCRDPRWGRLEETYGEDPYLVARMGVEFVRGLQGPRLTEGVVATAKHFVGYGASEGGMNWAPAHIGERELHDVYLRPFEHAVRDADIASVMNAYHEIDGVPCAANRWLLTELLREQWGFDGTVVSDYFAVKQLDEYHHVVDSPGSAAAVALDAGIDVELPNTDCYGDELKRAIERGDVSMTDVDDAVGRVLTSKLRLGLFEQPLVDLDRIRLHTRTDAQLDLARDIARDSLVLVKNDGVLPLTTQTSIAVIGPNAADARNMFGDYSYVAHFESLTEVLESGNNVFAMPLDHRSPTDHHQELDHVPTVLDAIAERFDAATIRHEVGCPVIGDDRSGFDAAVAAAAASDVAVCVMGDKSGLTTDCTSGESRDVASLDLPGVQEDLVLAVVATGTPVVLVLIAGRPTGSVAVHDAAAAVLLAWLPGECGADAIADAVAGVSSPGGKLPVNHPRGVGQIPTFYSHKVSGGRSHWKGPYVDLSNAPLYPFGFGLTYSRFAIDVDALDGPVVASADIVDVTATVRNVGAATADEVVQLYTRDPVASITRPVLELQGFARVGLAPGTSARVTFHLPVDALGFAGADMAYVLEPGRIDVFVGTSSADLQDAGHLTIDGDGPIRTQRALAERVTIDML